MKKLLMILIVALIFFISCESNVINSSSNKAVISEYSNSDCLGSPYMATGEEKAETLVCEVVDKKINVTDKNAVFNCCAEIKCELKQTGNTIEIIEKDISNRACDCGCLFDVKCTISNLGKGTYTIKIGELQKEVTVN